MRGRFVVFDGPDGSGKSTQFIKLDELVRSAGIEVCEVREPGGTYIGEQVRQILLDPTNTGEVDVYCEMLLFMASRAQLVAERIRPAIEAGKLVLADRFISSTLAYQGAAGGVSVQDILSVGRIALRGTWPDLVVVFDVDLATARQRMNPLLREKEFDADHDRMEIKGAEFHKKVRQGYLDQAKDDPEHYLVIDARDDEQTVFTRLIEGLRSRFG
ncbi:MAG: dTMP kinase [Phycisphaeraceae bacterium]